MYILKHLIPVNYADDNTLCAKGETLGEVLERVRQDTEAAIDWFDNNKMQANPIKFQYTHTSKTEDIVFKCEDIQIQADEIVKLLGIHIDNMLKFTENVDFSLTYFGDIPNYSIQKPNYLSFIHSFRPTENYCPLIWINRNRTEMKHIENVHKRASKLFLMIEFQTTVTC